MVSMICDTNIYFSALGFDNTIAETIQQCFRSTDVKHNHIR